jgi:hypothetical protein
VDQNDIDLLKTRIKRVVRFCCKDGEVIVGTVHFVSDEEQDVIYDLISSNRMSRYESFGNAAYLLAFEEIEFVTLPGELADHFSLRRAHGITSKARRQKDTKPK